MTSALGIGVFLSVAMACAWLWQRRTGNAGWVDCVWSFAMGAGGVAAALLPDPAAASGRQIAVALLVAAWSLRLGLHIAARSAHGPEDARYAALRHEWGADFQRRLFWFLQIQAAAAALLVLSMGLAAHNPAPFPRLVDLLALALLVIAVAGEGWSDAWLRRFKTNPANSGRVCDTGPWAWSRHPNYFFEWLGWLAYSLLAIDGFGWGWLALSGPAFMYYLLVHVSGIPFLERQMLASRGDAYRAYQARVSAFFPLPSKR
jgi:steroid 5-alpha reductase family enzyme